MGVFVGGRNVGVAVGGNEAFSVKIFVSFLRKIKRLEATTHFNVNFSRLYKKFYYEFTKFNHLVFKWTTEILNICKFQR